MRHSQQRACSAKHIRTGSPYPEPRNDEGRVKRSGYHNERKGLEKEARIHNVRRHGTIWDPKKTMQHNEKFLLETTKTVCRRLDVRTCASDSMLKPEKENIVEVWGNGNLMALGTGFEWTSVRGQCVVLKPVSSQVSWRHPINQGILGRWNADARSAPQRRRSDAISSTFHMQRRVGRHLRQEHFTTLLQHMSFGAVVVLSLIRSSSYDWYPGRWSRESSRRAAVVEFALSKPHPMLRLRRPGAKELHDARIEAETKTLRRSISEDEHCRPWKR